MKTFLLLGGSILFACLQGAKSLAASRGEYLSLDDLKSVLRELASNGVSKESMLGNRLDLNLDRTRIGISRIENAGRGLFAKADCQKGDLLTCYPGDIVLRDLDNDFAENQGGGDNWVWGSHVQESDFLEEDEIQKFMIGYILQVTDDVAILGLPTLDENIAYAGHFANDGGRPPKRESQIAAYVLESNDLSNAMHISVEDCHMATVATRDIKKDEEILVTYGPDYWMEQPSWTDDLDGPEEAGMEIRKGTGKGFG